MPRPTGYDVSFERACVSRGDCVIGVGFDTSRGDITRFLVDLQYTASFLRRQYTQIARIDHNPSNPSGHDIRSEGLHVDAVSKHGRSKKYWPVTSPVPPNLADVVDASAAYLDESADFFVDFYEGNHRPGNAPVWSP